MFKRQQKTITQALLITTAIILIANYLYRDSLYAMGVDLVVSLQDDHSSMGQGFFQLVTMISEPGVVMVAVLGIALGETRRKHAFNVTVFLLLNIYLITLLKEFYLDPRPFWTHPAAHSLGFYCPGEFGNPSGHSWFATVISFLVFLKYFPRVRKVYALGSVSLVILLVAVSRMYLGAHSVNQVALGVSLGMAMNVLYYVCGLDDQISAFLENFNIEPMLGWKKYMLLFHGLYFLAYLMG
jgi:membrane-associated phospholipid phosphatase